MEVYNKNSGLGYAISFSHGTVEYDPRKHSAIKAMMREGDSLMYTNKKLKNNVISIDRTCPRDSCSTQ